MGSWLRIRKNTMKNPLEFWRNRLHEQRKWIEKCESSGRSYTGPNGQAIRQADEAELQKLERTVAELTARLTATPTRRK